MFESFSRRRLFTLIAAGLAGASVGANRARAGARQDAPQAPDKGSLPLTEFEPRSMLHVTETQVPRARFPVIDVHTHVTRRAKSTGGVSQGEAIIVSAPPRDILPAMDRRNIRIMVNLTGSSGEGLSEAIRTFQQPHPDRFVVFTEPSWDRVAESGYAAWQADELGRAKAAGARGIKVLKTLGLYVREQVTSGPLIAIDDKRFDPMWEACGALGFPVAIHIADPEAFFLPIDRFNERYEELHAHPDWSFYGKDYPSFDALIVARDRVLARHPKTTFIGLHVGHDSENLVRVGEALDKFPNLHVEIGARIGELGRQPRTSRKFFDRYQDRILFGTDAVPGGTNMPQQIFGDNLYSIYFRFLETEDENFDYAPAKIPPQGRWRIYGLGLPDDILRKVYYANAERIIGIARAMQAE